MRGRAIWMGIGLAVFLWIYEVILHFVFFQQKNWLKIIFFPGPFEFLFRLFMAMIVIGAAILINLLQEKAKQTEWKFVSLIKNSPNIIYFKSLDGRNLLVNPAFEKLVGKPEKEIEGKKDEELLPADLAEQCAQSDREVIEKLAPVEVEETMHNADGSIRSFSTTKFPIFSSDGKLVGIGGISRDTTRTRLLLEAVLKVNECFLSFGSDSLRNLELLCQTAGKILNAVCVLYNRKEGELLKTLAGWQLPPDFQREDRGKGHLCFDVIEKGGEEPIIIRNLMHTKYAETDPNVKKYNLQTYISYPVKLNGEPVASFCAVYQKDVEFLDFQLRLLQILGKAASVEEEQMRYKKLLEDKIRDLETFEKMAVGREMRMMELEKEVNSLLSELGRAPKYK